MRSVSAPCGRARAFVALGIWWFLFHQMYDAAQRANTCWLGGRQGGGFLPGMFEQSLSSRGGSSFCSPLCCHQMTSSPRDPLRICTFRYFNYIINNTRIIWMLCFNTSFGLLVVHWICKVVFEIQTTNNNKLIIQITITTLTFPGFVIVLHTPWSHTVWWEQEELVILGTGEWVDWQSWARQLLFLLVYFLDLTCDGSQMYWHQHHECDLKKVALSAKNSLFTRVSGRFTLAPLFRVTGRSCRPFVRQSPWLLWALEWRCRNPHSSIIDHTFYYYWASGQKKTVLLREKMCHFEASERVSAFRDWGSCSV